VNWPAGKHLQCLDTFQVESLRGRPLHDCAILLEIWDTGGLLQTNVPIPVGTSLRIPSLGAGVCAEVVSCEQDEYGFLVEMKIDQGDWFPQSYIPPYYLSDGAPST
jgi:hypothetical protein